MSENPHPPAFDPADPLASHADPAMGPPALHAPWRLAYLESLGEPLTRPARPGPEPDTGSFIRDYWLAPERDREHHVIVRTGVGMILLNKFPYANGHLLVALGDARPRLLDYDTAQRRHLWQLTEIATDLLERALEPQGVNMGINQGRAAGAGVPQHLHVHLVPRWGGDVNFLSVVGRVRVIPSSLDAMAERFRATWARLRTEGLHTDDTTR